MEYINFCVLSITCEGAALFSFHPTRPLGTSYTNMLVSKRGDCISVLGLPLIKHIIYSSLPSDLKINKNTSRRDRKSSTTNKKCDKDNLTGKALLKAKLSNRQTKNQQIKPPQPKTDILSLVNQPPKIWVVG